MSPPDNRSGPRRGRPGGLAAKPDTRGECTPTNPHAVYMRQLGQRIASLDTHVHWWIRDVRRHQAECTWCRRCDGDVAA